ncbi:MAG: hypothetical protein ACE5H3_10785 [Planctomycetota bacterium]
MASERAALVEVRALADVIADTTDMNVHQLGDLVRAEEDFGRNTQVAPLDEEHLPPAEIP